VDTGERQYRICDFCGEIMLLEDVFVYAEERMLVCRSCSTAEFWSVGAGPSDHRGGGRSRF
jgi:hypothetical protein